VLKDATGFVLKDATGFVLKDATGFVLKDATGFVLKVAAAVAVLLSPIPPKTVPSVNQLVDEPAPF
jgi:hypothetical protein